ncbi:MAG: hypothetical protein OH337_04095 [Candidatus Parvarchaeota archaeon]|nr:hypothetical protein [Candidatus Haiyanarchaeum thermophilum]
MRVWKNRSESARCAVCGHRLAYGEPCVKLDTIYFYRGCRSSFLHFKCIDEAIELLKSFKKELEVKYMLWKVEGKA